jgi:hypothetical protein
MAFSTDCSRESVPLASRRRLADSELPSPLGGICFRRFQKKHITIRSSLIRAFTAEVAHECQTCSSLLPYTEQKSVTLRTYRAVGREEEKRPCAERLHAPLSLFRSA